MAFEVDRGDSIRHMLVSSFIRAHIAKPTHPCRNPTGSRHTTSPTILAWSNSCLLLTSSNSTLGPLPGALSVCARYAYSACGSTSFVYGIVNPPPAVLETDDPLTLPGTNAAGNPLAYPANLPIATALSAFSFSNSLASISTGFGGAGSGRRASGFAIPGSRVGTRGNPLSHCSTLGKWLLNSSATPNPTAVVSGLRIPSSAVLGVVGLLPRPPISSHAAIFPFEVAERGRTMTGGAEPLRSSATASASSARGEPGGERERLEGLRGILGD